MFRLTLGGLGRQIYSFVEMRLFTVVVTVEKARGGFMQIGFFVRVDREASERSDFCERQKDYFVAGALYSFLPLKPLASQKTKGHFA